jgi:hypothetical protein
MSNDLRLEGVEGNVWFRPTGLNTVYVDAHQHSGMDEADYDPADRLAPRFLVHRGRHYTHSGTWKFLDGEWLPLGYASDGNTVTPFTIERMAEVHDPGNVRPRNTVKVYDRAPVKYATAMLLSIQSALTAWSDTYDAAMARAESAHAVAASLAANALVLGDDDG